MTLIDSSLLPLTLIAALDSGLVAGIFVAFSYFVLDALHRIQPNNGISAMQSINATVINPVFLGLFLGTAVASLLLGGCSFLRWQRPGSAWLLAGAGVYLVGSLLVTIVGNVPLNEALAGLDPWKLESAAFWQRFVANWSRWNHVRAGAALLASAAFTVGLTRLAQAGHGMLMP